MFKCVCVGVAYAHESMWPQAPKTSHPLELELHMNVKLLNMGSDNCN